MWTSTYRHCHNVREFTVIVNTVMSSLSAFGRHSSSVAVATAAVAVLTVAHTSRTQTQDATDVHSKPFEAHLLDKIRNKSYLQGGQDAIPERLRLLVIDLPDLSQHILGDCRTSHSHLFPDDVAKPKRLDWKRGGENNPNSTSSKHVDIVQKVVVKVGTSEHHSKASDNPKPF